MSVIAKEKNIRRKKGDTSKRASIINHHLLRSDLTRVAIITGYARGYVYHVLEGLRNNDKVLVAALEIAKQNRKLFTNK